MLISFLLTSCSQIKTIPLSPKKILTREEQLKEAALLRYRQMRMESWSKYKTANKKYIKKIPSKVVKVKPIKKFIPITKEMIIEGEQRCKWYCMKNRKSERFLKEGSCLRFISDLQKKCELKTISEPGTYYVKCLKAKLKL